MRTPKSTLFIFTVLFAGTVTAQNFDDIFRTGPEDATKYLENYVAPVMNSLSSGLSGGWNNTAKPHKLLGFDITVTANVASIPSSDKTWIFRNADFTNLLTNDPSGQVELPTMMGSTTNEELNFAPNVSIGDQNFTAPLGTIPAAQGLDIPLQGVPVPMLQIGVGLVKNTDLKIRFLPSYQSEELEFSLFGIGVLHDIKQWIPGLKQVPIAISGFIGHTRMNTKYIISDATLGDPNFTLDVTGGSADFQASSTVIQILASKKLAILTPYIGIGFNATSSSFDVKGAFDYTLTETTDLGTITTDVSLTDPVSLNFDGGSSPTLMAGLRLKLLIFSFHADYTLQKYNMFSAGVGINVR